MHHFSIHGAAWRSLFNPLYANDAKWRHVRDAKLTPIGVNDKRLQSSSKPVGLASCLWLLWTLPDLDMALGHAPILDALDMNKVYPSVFDNGDRPRAWMRRFLQQDSSYRTGLSFVTELE